MTHFLDDRPFDLARKESSDLLRILSKHYWEASKTQILLRKIGGSSNGVNGHFPLQDIPWQTNASQFWVNILVTASDQLLLRDLVKVVLDDDGARAYHGWLDALLKAQESSTGPGSPDPAPTAGPALNDQTWDLIARLLASHFLGAGDVRASLATVLPEVLLSALQIDGDADEILHEVIEALKASAVLGESPPILHTLEAMLGIASIAALPESEFLGAAVGSVKEFVERLRTRPPSRDAVDEFVLFNGEVFLNRGRLRDSLKALLGAKLALVVKGPPDSGKTYCSRLILHLAKTKGFKVAKVTHEEAASPKEFVDFLRMSMKVRDSFELSEIDQEKWNRHASRWLVSEAQKSGGRYWFIIDGFNKSRIDGSLKEVITALTQYIAEETDGSLRVVLLDYDEPLPRELGNRLVKEELGFLKETDVREFFTSFFGEPRKGVQGPVDQYVEKNVKQAWQTAEDLRQKDKDRHFMELLKEEVEKIVSVHA